MGGWARRLPTLAAAQKFAGYQSSLRGGEYSGLRRSAERVSVGTLITFPQVCLWSEEAS